MSLKKRMKVVKSKNSLYSLFCRLWDYCRSAKGVWVRQEIAQDHPVSSGGHCCKGSDMIDMVRSHVRLKYPMKKKMENGNA